MQQRCITEDEVIDVLETPDEMFDGDMGEAIAVQRAPDGELRVVLRS
jgi:hypothetical protein